jgi:hypothetical protein
MTKRALISDGDFLVIKEDPMEVIVRVDGEGIRSASMDVSDVMAAED